MKLAAAFFAVIPLAFGGVEKVWELRLGDLVNEQFSWPVTGLAFSSDGKHLAIALDFGGMARVFVLDVASPKAEPQDIPLNVRFCLDPPAWSPGSAAVLVCGTIVKLADGLSCTFPKVLNAGFGFSPDLWFDAQRVLHFGWTFNFECAADRSWIPASKGRPGEWGIAAVEPGRGWALIWRRVGVPPNESDEFLIEDVHSRKLLGKPVRLPADFLPRPNFVPGADAWCASTEKRPRCWNVLDGNEIRVSHTLNGFRFSGVATLAPRAIAEHWTHAFFCFLCSWEINRRAIWDFKLGKMIASWNPHRQRLGQMEPPEEVDRCAISPDGELVAEGGDGVVRLYRLTP